MSLVVCRDEAELALKAADVFVAARPSTAAFSGGETPRRTYEELAKREIEWGTVDSFLTDERCVPLNHPSSNYRMLSETLLGNASFRGHPVDVEVSPEEAATKLAEELESQGPFDFIFLGLGADGHTASLFPGAGDSSGIDRLAIRTWSKETGMWRVSLTLKAINSARQVVFLVSGQTKSHALSRLLRGDPIPASKVKPDGRLIILADRHAASLSVERT